MAITDLTGTTWYWNDTLTSPPGNTNINFTCNNVNYTSMEGISEAGGYLLIYRSSSSVTAYDSTFYASTPGWQDETYRTITITGGTDATNAALIAFLEANAIQVEDSGGGWRRE